MDNIGKEIVNLIDAGNALANYAQAVIGSGETSEDIKKWDKVAEKLLNTYIEFYGEKQNV